MRVRAILAEADGIWTATAQDIGCPQGCGDTPEDAIADLREAIAEWAAARGCALKVPAGA